MIHDEPANRPGQDPYACAPESEEHYGAQIRHYQELLSKVRAGTIVPPREGVAERFEADLQRYQGWLQSLINRKRSDRIPISFDYAEPDDIVFIEGECPFSGGGTPYTKTQMLNVCMGDVVAAKRLTIACREYGAKRYSKVSEGGYEGFVYNDDLAAIRKNYGSETIYNRVVLVHDHGKLTEIVFARGLDHLVGDYDPIADFDEWDQRLDQLRESLADFSRRTLGEEARLVRFSPSKDVLRGPMPLFDDTDSAVRSLSIEPLHASLHSDIPIKADVTFPDELSRSLDDALQLCAETAHSRP